jgi:hypothetical protein
MFNESLNFPEREGVMTIAACREKYYEDCRLEEIELAKKFYELYPQCHMIEQTDAIKRMKRIIEKESRDNQYKIRQFFEPQSSQWFYVLEGSEFDTQEAEDIRTNIEWENEHPGYTQQDVYERNCKSFRIEQECDDANFEQLIVESINGLSIEEAERIEIHLRNERHANIWNEFDPDSYDAYRPNDLNDFGIHRIEFGNRREQLLKEYRSFLHQENKKQVMRRQNIIHQDKEKKRQNILHQEKKESKKMIFDRSLDKGTFMSAWMTIKTESKKKNTATVK